MISIICPTYNSEKTIKNLINSIETQSYKNYEVIFVDKFSSDKTKELVNNSKIEEKYLYEKLDNGIYDAINYGISKANFNWIWILGSDDVIYKSNTIEFISKEIEKEQDDKIVAIYGKVICLSAEERYNYEFNYNDHFIKSLCQQAIIYRKEALINKNGFKTKYITTADYVLNLELLSDKKNKFKYIKEPISLYNERGASFRIKDKNFNRDSLSIRLRTIGTEVKKHLLIKIFIGRKGIIYTPGEINLIKHLS